MERRKGRELVWIQVRGLRGHEVIRAPELGHGLVEDLVHRRRACRLPLLELVPGWRRRKEQVGHKSQEGNQQEGCYEAAVVLSAAQPEGEPDDDRERGGRGEEEQRPPGPGGPPVRALKRLPPTASGESTRA